MLALTAQVGDVAVRTDDGNHSYILLGNNPTTLTNWVRQLTTADAPVQSVAGRQGSVVLVKADVGLSLVDNTSDLSKPISTATQTALDAKVALTRTISTTTPLQGGGDLSANLSLSILQASTSVSGFLSFTDWNTFNNKQPLIAAGTTAQYRRGDNTWQTLNQAAVAGLTTTDSPTFASLTLSKAGAGVLGPTMQLTHSSALQVGNEITQSFTFLSSTHGQFGMLETSASGSGLSDFVWRTYNGTALGERMRLFSTGGLAVGSTTDPGFGIVAANGFVFPGGGLTITKMYESWGINVNGDASHPVRFPGSAVVVGDSSFVSGGSALTQGNLHVQRGIYIGAATDPGAGVLRVLSPVGTTTPSVIIKNLNTTGVGRLQFVADNTAADADFGIRNSAISAYGPLIALDAFIYTPSHITLMADGSGKTIKFAAGGNTLRMVLGLGLNLGGSSDPGAGNLVATGYLAATNLSASGYWDAADFTTWSPDKLGPVSWYNMSGPSGTGFHHGYRSRMADGNYGNEIAINYNSDRMFFRRYAGGFGSWQELANLSGANFAGLQVGSGATLTKILSNTASLSWSGLAGNTIQNQTITVTGAAVGDPVHFGIPAASAGSTRIWYAFVSAADTVMISCYNPPNASSVSAIGATTMRVVVMKF